MLRRPRRVRLMVAYPSCMHGRPAALAQLCREHGIAPVDQCKRVLLVSSLEVWVHRGILCGAGCRGCRWEGGLLGEWCAWGAA